MKTKIVTAICVLSCVGVTCCCIWLNLKVASLRHEMKTRPTITYERPDLSDVRLRLGEHAEHLKFLEKKVRAQGVTMTGLRAAAYFSTGKLPPVYVIDSETDLLVPLEENSDWVGEKVNDTITLTPADKAVRFKVDEQGPMVISRDVWKFKYDDVIDDQGANASITID